MGPTREFWDRTEDKRIKGKSGQCPTHGKDAPAYLVAGGVVGGERCLLCVRAIRQRVHFRVCKDNRTSTFMADVAGSYAG